MAQQIQLSSSREQYTTEYWQTGFSSVNFLLILNLPQSTMLADKVLSTKNILSDINK